MESVVLALSSKYFVFASTCWQLCFWHFSCSFVRKRRQLFRLNQRFLFSQKKKNTIENCAGVILLLHNFFLVRLRQSWSRQKPIDLQNLYIAPNQRDFLVKMCHAACGGDVFIATISIMYSHAREKRDGPTRSLLSAVAAIALAQRQSIYYTKHLEKEGLFVCP